MFTVNRQDLFISLPIESESFDLEIGYDGCAYLTAITYNVLERVHIHLTAQQITDMISSLEEIKRRSKD